MRRLVFFVLALFSASCAQPEDQILPSHGNTDLVAQPLDANARLARYNGKRMRIRVFTKSGGPRILRATMPLEFSKVGSRLEFRKGREVATPIYLGKGFDVVSSFGRAQEPPPCNMEVPLNEQPECLLPLCETVSNVEPCRSEEEGGGGEGGGDPEDPYVALISDTSVINRAATSFTTVASHTPVPLDSVPSDSAALFVQDTNSIVFGTVLDADGHLLSSIVANDSGSSTVTFSYEGTNLLSMTVIAADVQGDTLVMEITPELMEGQLRMDQGALHMGYMQQEAGPCETLRKARFSARLRFGLTAVGAAAAVGTLMFPAAEVARTIVSNAETVYWAGSVLVQASSSGIWVPQALAAAPPKRNIWLSFPGIGAVAAVGGAILEGVEAWNAGTAYNECLETHHLN